MANRSKKKKVAKKVNTKRLSSKVSNEIEHLEILLGFSLKAVDGRSEDLDKLFTDQANKIRAQIEELKEQ